MKKLVIGITIAVMVLSISAMSAFAASEAPGYVDADGDGICDNCAGAGANCPGYVDADGDGVCDNYGSGNGQGHGHGRHHGGGHGCAR